MKKQYFRNNRGFTLVEMLIVVAIIGVLATVTFIAINPARTKSRDARRAADMNAILQAAVQYQDDHSGDAPPAGAGQGLECLTGASTCPDPDIGYLARLPEDPVNDSTYAYTYMNNGSDSSFVVQFRTEGPATHLDSQASNANGNTFCLTSSGIEFKAADTTASCGSADEK